MGDKRIAVLGGSFLQADFVETALKRGLTVFVLDGNKDCYISRWDTIEFHHLDFSEEHRVEKFCTENRISFVYAPCNEVGNLISSRIAKKMGFRYNPEEVVQITLNKSMQRERATMCGELFSPLSLHYKGNLDEIEASLDYPMVIKPTNSSGGRGITGVQNREEMKHALEEAERFVHADGEILVEEYVPGDQISVETISVDGRHYIAGITLEIVSPEPLFIERSHYMNESVHNRFYPKVHDAVVELLDKIGVVWGPCHIELKVSGDKVALIEIASRAGGLRDRLMMLAGYSDYNTLILDAYMNGEIDQRMLHAPDRHGLANILTKTADLESVVLGKRDETLHSLYLYERGPVYNPQNIIDAYGYAYFSDAEELNAYSLEHY